MRLGAERCKGIEVAFVASLCRLPDFDMRLESDEPEVVGRFNDRQWDIPLIEVRAQENFGSYRADFAFHHGLNCGAPLLVVELDELHHRKNWPDDQIRDRYFLYMGTPVLRFMEWEVRKDPAMCAFIAAFYAQWQCEKVDTEESLRQHLWHYQWQEMRAEETAPRLDS